MYYLYFIKQENTNLIKIGITKNLRRRLSQLQVGNPFKLEVTSCWKCRSKQHIKKAERIVHNFLTSQGFLVRGEWYKCNPYVTMLQLQSNLQAQKDILKDFSHLV